MPIIVRSKNVCVCIANRIGNLISYVKDKYLIIFEKQIITLYYSITNSFTDRMVTYCNVIVTLMGLNQQKLSKKKIHHRLAY